MVLYDYLVWCGYFDDLIAVTTTACAIAHQAGAIAAEAGAWNNLGIALNGASRYAEALAAYERALALFASLDDHNERGKALNGKGPALHDSGKPAEALLIHQEALAIQRAVGDLREQAAVLNNLSLDHQELENYAEACATAEEAASLFQRLGDPTNEANALCAAAFSAGNGAKGPRFYDWAWVHVGTGSHRHLLIRRNRSTGELAFYLCWSPTEVPLSALVRVAGIRWSVEECLQAAKGQVGLDHYQVRHWTSWHRHVTLAMLALAFLTAIAADAASRRPAETRLPARSSDPITLTVPEFRYLLAAVFHAPAMTAARLLHWSTWRRHHQATARRSHYRRRVADESAG